MKLDMLFIDPPWIIENKDNIWRNVGSCLPNLGMAYIASVLEQDGKKIAILDCTAERLFGMKNIEERLRVYRKPSFIGITATTPLINNGLKIAQACRQIIPEAKIIFGGVHVSVMPDEILSHPAVDFVVKDEGEITTRELVNGVSLDNILGLSWKVNGKIIHNRQRPLIENLDEIPPPAYHLLPMKRYRPAIGSYKRLPAMSIFATRGCPARCTFCHRTFYGKVRARSATNILKEIKILKRDYGIKEIAFYDDTFTAFKNIVKEFCERVVTEKIDISWSCFTRVDYIDSEILKYLKKAGCHLVLFGVESADEQILKNINKKVALHQVEWAVKECRKLGIETRASFMIGNPGETEETIKKTIEFAIKLDPDEIQFNITTAYPGTELFSWAKSNGLLLTEDWSKYNMSEINMAIPTVTADMLRKYYKLSHRKFYLRPKVIFKRFLKIRNFTQFFQEIKGFFAILKVFRSKK